MGLSRTHTALVGLALSVAVSVLAWVYFHTFVVFLVVPLVPLLFRSLGGDDRDATVSRCPDCGFTTRNPEFTHCPYDGRRLEAARTER